MSFMFCKLIALFAGSKASWVSCAKIPFSMRTVVEFAIDSILEVDRSKESSDSWPLQIAPMVPRSLCHWANRSGFSSLLPVGLMNRCQLLGDGPFWFGVAWIFENWRWQWVAMDGTGIISFMASLGMCSSHTRTLIHIYTYIHTHIYIIYTPLVSFGDNLILCYHPGTCLTSQLPTASGWVTWNSWDGFGFGSSEQLLRWDTVVPELSERTMERRDGKVPGLIGILYISYISCCSNSLFGLW